MHIRNAKDIQGYASSHGEIVYELAGHSAGGSEAHSVAQIILPPGKASLKHYHPVAEESYYILSGTACMEVDGQTTMLGSGDTIAIVPPCVHQIFNAGDVDLVFLAVCAPAWTPDNSIFLD